MSRSAFPLLLLTVVGLVAAFSACGGDSASSPTPATTLPSTSTTTTTLGPAPSASPTPYDCNRTSLPAGPVATYRYKLKVIWRGEDYIEGPPEGAEFPTDDEGRIIVRVGDFIVFDSTQKNGSGEICQWRDDPRWTVIDPEGVLSIRDEASRKTTACGFLLRADVMRKGAFTVDASLDGVDGETIYGRQPQLELVAVK